MPSNPGDFARQGHRTGLYLTNLNQAATWINRLQTIDPNFTSPTDIYFELGTIDPVGFAVDPTEFKLSYEENMAKAGSDFILANKDPLTALSFNMNDIISSAGSPAGYIVMRQNAATNPTSVFSITSMTTSELNYRFQVRQPSTFSPTIQASVGRWNIAAGIAALPAAVATWGAADLVNPGAIRGRDARICFGSIASANKQFRVQSFSIKATFPATRIDELDNRNIVGFLVGSPDVTVDYDLLLADDQPHDIWANLTANYYDFNNLTGGSTVYITLYSPTAAADTTAVRGWRVDNCVPVSATPVRSQVRGLSTVRYSLRVSKVNVAASGGLTVFRGAPS